MEKLRKAQVARAVVLFLFLFLTPFMYSSVRPSHVYFLLNLLILVLAIDSEAPEERLMPMAGNVDTADDIHTYAIPGVERPVPVVVEEEPESEPEPEPAPVPEKTIQVDSVQEVENCPSSPSLFFVDEGGEEEEEEEEESESERKEASTVATAGDESCCEEISSQELYTRAEAFIGNFYKQLEIQREESWKSFRHGLYKNNPIEVS